MHVHGIKYLRVRDARATIYEIHAGIYISIPIVTKQLSTKALSTQ